MKTVKFVIVSKGRKYFDCRVNGYKAKLEIDETTADLTGEVELLCEDLSVRSKFGTELKFRAVKGDSSKPADEIVTVRHDRYNWRLVKQARSLGGKWDEQEKVWVFSGIVADKAEELDEIWASELVTVEITAKKKLCGDRDSVDFLGYQIARATGRDSGARLGEGVAKLSGAIESGGSMKNWSTVVLEGSLFRIQVPRLALDRYSDSEKDNWDVKEVAK